MMLRNRRSPPKTGDAPLATEPPSGQSEMTAQGTSFSRLDWSGAEVGETFNDQ